MFLRLGRLPFQLNVLLLIQLSEAIKFCSAIFAQIVLCSSQPSFESALQGETTGLLHF